MFNSTDIDDFNVACKLNCRSVLANNDNIEKWL